MYVQKWLKAKQLVGEILVEVEKGDSLDRKSLERRGFLFHVQCTYPAINPYLKGLHLTIDSWQAGWDEDGWKISSSTSWIWHEDNEDWESWSQEGDLNPPSRVKAAPRSENDLRILFVLFQPELPRLRYMRSRQVTSVAYGSGDASRSGVGSSIQTGQTLHVRQGVWVNMTAAES